LKKLTCGAAVLGMSAGMFLIAGASAASAASTTIRPYIGFQPSAGIGATDAGVWDSESCIIGIDGDHPGNGGKINNVVVAGHTGELNVTYAGLTSGDPVPSCTPIDIGLTGTASVTPGTKPGGFLAVTTTAGLQGGVDAFSITTIDVSLAAAQSVKVPSGGTQITGAGLLPVGTLTGPGTVRFKLKITEVKTKAVAATPASCTDEIHVIDTTQHDVKLAPVATKWDGSTIPPATSYFATIRSCAGSPAAVAGKPVITKLSIAGDGATSASFVEAQTVNPKTWDQTMGTCGTVKTAAVGTSFGATALDVSRVIQCKGDFGAPVPFALDVRGFTTNGGQDPNGLQHAQAPLNLGGGTFSN